MENVEIITMSGLAPAVVSVVSRSTPLTAFAGLTRELMNPNAWPVVPMFLPLEEVSVKTVVIARIISDPFVAEMEPPMITHVNWIARESLNYMRGSARRIQLINVSSVKEILREFVEMMARLMIMSAT